MKIKASYTTDKELDALIRLLSPITKKYKIAKNQTGQYKKAYFDIEMEGRRDNASIQGQ